MADPGAHTTFRIVLHRDRRNGPRQVAQYKAACVRHLDTRPEGVRRVLLAERDPPWGEWARVIRAACEMAAKELEQYVSLPKR
eukprot:2839457-Pyramimonas_sp.AAC.1